LITLGLTYVNVRISGKNPFEYGDNFKPCMVRAITGTISFTTMNLGLMNLPLAIFSTIFNSTPFVTAILAYFYLKESITMCEVIAMAGSFSGIIMIAFSTPHEGGEQNQTLDEMNNPIFGPNVSPTFKYVVGVTGVCFTAVFMSICYIATRAMKDLHYSVIQFNYALVNTVSVGIIILIQCAWKSYQN